MAEDRSYSFHFAAPQAVLPFPLADRIQAMAMASSAPPGSAMPSSTGRVMPLHCTVCPETPHFSDVSHLLTHIASKGHLHHETQTRLRSHQDLSASLALQQYEHWYKENGIETLLVDRLAAKQIKEAARRKRARPSGLVSSPKTKRKSQRSTDETIKEQKSKTEDDIFADLPSLPPMLDSPDNFTDEFCLGSDVLSLKGQIWPGMGKMDLANEEMKRTRNQRKPKSVIDKMRRTSEGIEPTQVIMTPKLEVQRIKDVYDEASSPVSGKEETTPPRKITKPRRKRTEPLAEISVNVKRGTRVRDNHNRTTHNKKSVKPSAVTDHDDETAAGLLVPWETLQRARALFPDDETVSSPFDETIYNTPNHREYKLGIRERLGIHTINPIARSNLASPIKTSKVAHGHDSSETARRERSQTHLFGNQGSLGSLGHNDTAFPIHDDPVYNTPGRVSHGLGGSFNGLNHEHFHGLPVGHVQIKQESFGRTLSNDHFHHPAQPYLNISGGNPLLSQSRGFLDAYDQSTSNTHFPCLGFTPINRDDRKEFHGHEQKLSVPAHNDSRMTKDSFETADTIENFAKREPGYHSLGLWATESPQDDLGLPE